ncbi:hypothetical protein AALB39_19660 [Lachnospiraceae bacterium 54-53]
MQSKQIVCANDKAIKKKENTKMSEYKFKTEKIVKEAYKKIEDTVVKGYQKTEDTVVSIYKKVEQKFVDRFLEERDAEGTEEE